MDNGVGGVLYLKTHSGILKVLEVIFSLCAFISAMTDTWIFNWNISEGSFFNIVALIAFIYATLIIVLSVVNINLSMGPKIDFISCICLTILIFSSAALYTRGANINASVTAAVVFQYLNGFTFFVNTLYKVLV